MRPWLPYNPESAASAKILQNDDQEVTFFLLEYKCVKSRNSYTVVYIEDGREQFGKILFFLQLYTTSFAVL